MTPSSITPIPALPATSKNAPRIVGLASVVVAAITTLGAVIQALGGLPEVMKVLIAQGWPVAGALAVLATGLLVFRIIQELSSARAAAEERAERRDQRMGQMLNELASRDGEICTAITHLSQALEGLRQQMIARLNCPMIDARTDPAARVPSGPPPVPRPAVTRG